MTDKQIIDGVDVSGCEDYKCDGTCANSAYHLFNFETKYANCQNRNCYYKNWQRAEQKLDKIKKVCNKFIPDHYKILLIINGGIVEGKENE